MSSRPLAGLPFSRGFTLVEMLVAIAVFGLVTAMLTLAFRHSQAVVSAVVAARTDRNEVMELQQNLHAWLTSAHPFDAGRSPTQIFPLHGSSEELTFTAPLDVTNGQNDLYRIHIYVSQAKKTLVAEIAPDRDDIDDPATTTQMSLLNDVDTFTLSYLDGAASNTWLNNWSNRSDLPRAVKVDVNFPHDDPRHWVDFVTYLRVSGREHCDFDPVVRRCR